MATNLETAIKDGCNIIDVWLPWKIKHARVPGLTVGITYRGKLIYKNAFGYSDLEDKVPMRTGTCFRIASISKIFTATAIMQLVEAGKIKLDDKIVKYLPWMKRKAKDEKLDKITIKQLLSHTAGVFRDGDTYHWQNDKFPDLNGLKKSISAKTLVYENLTRFKYSNFGYALLGEIIHQASGKNYEDYVTENIINKLKLKRTAPDFTEDKRKWMAKGYHRPLPDEERVFFSHSQTKSYAPATGFLSNVQDMAKFLISWSWDYDGEQNLLSRESKKEMMKEVWDCGDNERAYGLGFVIREISKRKLVGHSGGFCGFITQIMFDKENNLGVIVLTNTNDSPAEDLGQGIFKLIYNLIDNHKKYSDSKKIANSKNFTGVYRSRWQDTAVVIAGHVLLSFDVRLDSPAETLTIMRYKAKNKFIMETSSNLDSMGEVATFEFAGKDKKAKRAIFSVNPADRLD